MGGESWYRSACAVSLRLRDLWLAAQHPLKAADLALALWARDRRLYRVLGCTEREIVRLRREMDELGLVERVARQLGPESVGPNGMLSPVRAPVLYMLVRALRPTLVVETGVADGVSSLFMLCAMERNGTGHLYSIDLPNQPGHILGSGREPGWLVPTALHARWRLVLESAETALPRVLADLALIDMFFHDSDHSYRHMRWELTTVWPTIRRGGVLVCDDITMNQAFGDFCRAVSAEPMRLHRLGIVRKS